jgi:hypothetical protein
MTDVLTRQRELLADFLQCVVFVHADPEVRAQMRSSRGVPESGEVPASEPARVDEVIRMRFALRSQPERSGGSKNNFCVAAIAR